MVEGFLYYIFAIFLAANLFVLVYLIVKDFGKLTDGKEQLNNNIKEYRPKKRYVFYNKVDNLIVKSNIKSHISWISTNAVVFVSLLFGVLGFIISYRYLNNAFTGLVFFIALSLFPIYILEAIISYNNSKIEKNFLYFLNILSNFAQLKDDVFFAFEKSVGYIDQPLKNYCKAFVEEVKRGLPIEDALENFKEKLDNNKFKLFLKNTQLCVKYGGSFLKLASNNLEYIKQLQIEKARRKNETALGRGMMYIMMAVNIALAIYMFNIYPGTIERVRTDFYGQVVVLINTVNLFIIFYLSIKLKKFDY